MSANISHKPTGQEAIRAKLQAAKTKREAKA